MDFLRRLCLVFLVGILATLVQPRGSAAEHSALATLNVVIDDNYPPYVFRDSNGTLIGYLVDMWRLWETKTGVRVDLQGSDWATAQQRMRRRQAEVIDTIFRTEERERSLQFLPAYEAIPVSIYAHAGIGGIIDLTTLRGFLVGVKAGDACIDRLASAGIRSLQQFASYEALVHAAVEGKVRVFCLDDPPARYLLYLNNAEQLFNQAFTLHTGEFHRAVHKGDAATMDLLQRGFASITAGEEKALREKWMGMPLALSPYARYLGYALVGGSLIGVLLLLWVMTLRRVVRQRTAKLAATLQAIPDLLFELGLDGRYHDYHSPRTELLVAQPELLIGKLVSDVLPAAAAASCLSALREAHETGYSLGQQFELLLPQGSAWFELSVARKVTGIGEEPRFVVLSRDISARKRAEMRLRMAIEATQLVFWELDLRNGSIRYDASMLQLLGLDQGEDPATSDALMELVHPDHRAELLLRFQEAMRPGDPVFGFEHSIINKAGQCIWLQTHGRVAQRDPAGRALLAVGTAMNISERKQVEQALRESEALKGSVLASAACGIVATDPKGLITVFNPGAEAIFGYLAEEVVGKVTPTVFHDGDEVAAVARNLSEALGFRVEAGFDALVARARCSGITDERERACVRKDGRHITVRLSVTVMRDAQGVLTGYLGTLVDITAQKQAAAQLDLAAKVFEQGGEGIAITDASGKMVMVNQAFTRITGYSETEALGQDPRLLASGRHGAAFYRGMWEAIASLGHWQGEIWNRRKDGSIYPEWLSISRVERNGLPTHYIGTFIDISQLKEAEASIQRLAHFDPLTGLPNRSLLNERVKHDLSRAHRAREPLALIFLDLDRFKNVNDSLGHRIGDELLVQVAERLTGAVREEDTVSRLGGDEFILLLPSADAAGAAHVATKLLEVAAPPYRIGQHELSCTASVGIAMYPVDGESFEALSMCADTAMYRAKQSGRNTYCFFTAEMQERSARTLQLENDLRRALEHGELCLHFQPQFAIDDRRLIGAEALLRWQHPELGMVSPNEFIPIAEESGLILPIGEWALRLAVRQMRAWQDAGLSLQSMAVNLSAVQFRQSNLTQVVSRILDEEGMPAQFLELELTESVAMDNPLAAIETMDKLRTRGVRMSIDDFGTGYSSMSYLKRFRVHKLKIDRSFVADLAADPDDEAIVTATISLAHALGLQTVAEGVESEAQLTFLRGKGCDEAQGYLFSKPLPAAQFEAFARASSLLL
jgi:diguanylate cyclase (GGDEF)-like protein/PAS domain S-box-containing protein